jgi:predicted NBD/HSP70 family sugar kinase
MAFISSGTGLGAGLVLNGVLYRGYHEAAGEVGYLLPGVEALGRRYGKFGAMENLVSATGIAERARRQLGGIRPDSELEKLSAAQVYQAARRGEPWAKEIVEEMVEFMSMVVANIATLLDPELIILGGGDSSAPDLLIQPILAKVEGVIQHVPRLEASQLGSQAVVMGGIALVLHLTKDYYVVQRLR